MLQRCSSSWSPHVLHYPPGLASTTSLLVFVKFMHALLGHGVGVLRGWGVVLVVGKSVLLHKRISGMLYCRTLLKVITYVMTGPCKYNNQRFLLVTTRLLAYHVALCSQPSHMTERVLVLLCTNTVHVNSCSLPRHRHTRPWIPGG